MFERFSDAARLVIVRAREEARMLNHAHIGTEHLLLGLLHEDGAAVEAFTATGIDPAAVRDDVERRADPGTGTAPAHIPFTPQAKKALELSLREALQLGHDYIGTEHLLLGLIREGEGLGALVLVDAGVDLNQVRVHVAATVGNRTMGIGLSRMASLDARLASIEDRLTRIEARLPPEDA